MLDLSAELFQIALGDAEQRLGKVADDRDHLFLARTPLLAQSGELLLRTSADEDVDGVAAFQQVGDQKPADETGAAGDEVSHRDSSSVLSREPPAGFSVAAGRVRGQAQSGRPLYGARLASRADGRELRV